jgi:carbonic anhydrase/acetyltransferase-like protein (isoleucine patch superfamily)
MRKPHLYASGPAFLADNATVVGKVKLARRVSVWYGCVVRGDVARIQVGEDTNIQDLTVVHPQHDEDIEIGSRVVIGHNVMVHGRTIGDDALIGMGAILLPGSRVGNGCLVGAGALVPMNMVIPDGHLALGNPARVIRPVRDEEKKMIQETVNRYLNLIAEHLRQE